MCKARIVNLAWLCGGLLLAMSLASCAEDWAHVKRVIDGDTVELNGGIRVRLIGVNAPERGRADHAEQPGAHRAYQWLRAAAQGRRVRVLYGVQREDSYQRRLAYLFDEEGRLLNLQLLQRGLATLNPYPPNLRFQADFFKAQEEARKSRRGIWGDPHYAPGLISSLAPQHEGQWGRFQGSIHDLDVRSSGVRFWFNASTYLWIPAHHLSYFGRLESYKGQRVEVSGWPRRRDRVWSMLIRHPSQIRRLSSDRINLE